MSNQKEQESADENSSRKVSRRSFLKTMVAVGSTALSSVLGTVALASEGDGVDTVEAYLILAV